MFPVIEKRRLHGVVCYRGGDKDAETSIVHIVTPTRRATPEMAGAMT